MSSPDSQFVWCLACEMLCKSYYYYFLEFRVVISNCQPALAKQLFWLPLLKAAYYTIDETNKLPVAIFTVVKVYIKQPPEPNCKDVLQTFTFSCSPKRGLFISK